MPTKSPGTTSRRGAGQDPSKREQILAGAARVFARDGFDAASMNDITREAGVSKSTIYVYFANKEELFEAGLQQRQEEVLRAVSTRLDGPGTIDEVLTRYGAYLVKALCCDLAIKAHHLVIGVIGRKPELARMLYRGGRQRGVAVLRQYLDRKVAEGVLAIADTDLAAGQFISLCLSGTFRARLLADMEREPTEEEILFHVNAAVEMFLKCFGTAPRSPDPEQQNPGQ